MEKKSFYGFESTSRETWLKQVAKELKMEEPEKGLFKDVAGIELSAAPSKERDPELKAFHQFLAKRKTNWAIVADASDVQNASDLKKWGAQLIWKDINNEGLDSSLTYCSLSSLVNEIKPDVVDGRVLGDAGLSPAEQVAWMLSAGKYLADQHGDFASQSKFTFSIGPLFLPEIAKLRAFRWLWTKVASTFDNRSAEALQTKIFAGISPTYYTLFDKENNLLRATTGAMAAALGTADGIYIPPFDLPLQSKSGSAVRIGINIQHILKEESNIHLVGNPANGAFYIDALTKSIAEDAWNKLLEIEQNGGFESLSTNGKLKETMEASKKALQKLYDDKKLELVGDNLYPNTQENVAESLPDNWETMVKDHFRVSLSNELNRLKETHEKA